MKIYCHPPQSEWEPLLRRPQMERSEINGIVQSIIDRVRREGDAALYAFARDFDHTELESLIVSSNEIEAAATKIDPQLAAAIRTAAENIERFHTAQQFAGIDIETAPGVRCVQKSVPIRCVGLYVPGGTAPLFSTVLMLAIPARIAGCREIILCTPPDKTGCIAPAILYAARLCGVTCIVKSGGAQAIAAMAFGTESVPRTDKIFGPGNQYVTTAKQLLGLSETAIDMPAGPSEVMVLADCSANPRFIASDLLSQAEHGPDSQAILVTDSEAIARETEAEVIRQIEHLERKDYAVKSMAHSRIIVVKDRNELIEMANRYAAEHLIISLIDPWEAADRITAAGSVFIGNYTPKSAGDYASGTNHALPTNGWAVSYSGVNLDSFMRKITYQEISREGLAQLGPVIDTLAMAEGLDAHARAVRIRLESEK